MSELNENTKEFLHLVYKRLEKIEGKLDAIDDRVRSVEASVAVLNFKTGIISATGGVGGGTLVYYILQIMGNA